MKFIILSVFLFAIVSTGFSAPVDEQLPPIGGFGLPHDVMLNAAKEILTQVQDNLRAAGRIEESHHLNKFVKETEKMLVKAKSGVLRTEQFDLADHLDAVHSVLEKYKAYLPKHENNNKAVTSTVKNHGAFGLVVPTTEQLYEYLSKKMDEMIVKLKANHEQDRTHLLTSLKNAMSLLVLRDVHKTNSEEFAGLIGQVSQALVSLEQNF